MGRGTQTPPALTCLPPSPSSSPSLSASLSLCISFSLPPPSPVLYSLTSPISLSLHPLTLLLPMWRRRKKGRGVYVQAQGNSFLSSRTSARAEERTLWSAGGRRLGHGDPGGALAAPLGSAATGLAARLAPRYVDHSWVAGPGLEQPLALSPAGGEETVWRSAVWLWAREVPSLGSPGGETPERARVSQIFLCGQWDGEPVPLAVE